MPVSHIGLTGARKGMSARQFDALIRLLMRRPAGDVLHHGGAIGADQQAHFVALGLGMAVIVHPCDIPDQRGLCPGASLVHPPKPPLDRNRDIVAATVGIYAAPSGPEHVRSGTWATVREARRLGRSVVVVMPDGSVTVERPST